MNVRGYSIRGVLCGFLLGGYMCVVGVLVMDESSKRRKATVSRTFYNNKKFQSKEKSKLFRDLYKSRTVHLERNVKPNTFDSIPIRSVFDALGGDHVLLFSGPQNLSWVREFYCNMHSINTDITPDFKTWVRLKPIFVNEEYIRSFLGIPEVRNSHFPFFAKRIADFDMVASELCGTPRRWIDGTLIKQRELIPRFRLLNITVCANVYVTTHSSNISHDQGYVLYCIDRGLPINFSEMTVEKMILVFKGKKSLGLPYGCLVNRILSSITIPTFLDDEFACPVKPITKKTVSQSEAHVKETSSRVGGCGAGADMMDEEAELNVIVTGEGAQPGIGHTIQGQLAQFEQAMVARFDCLHDRMDTYDARLTNLETSTDARLTALEALCGCIEHAVGQSSLQLVDILSMLRMQQHTPPPPK